MRLLLFVGLLAAAACAAPTANTTGKTLSELINDIKHIEDDLMKTVFTDIKQDLKDAVENKKTLEEAAVGELAKKASEFKQKVTEALQKFNEAKEAAQARIEEKRQKMVEEFKAKLEEKKAAKEAELKEAKEKFDKFTQQVKEKLEAKKAEKEQKRQEMKAKLDELAQTIKENRETRKAEKEARKQEEKQERDAFLESFKSQLQSLEEEKKMLAENYDGFQKKEDELRQQLKDALGKRFKTSYADAIEDYLQDKLEKEYVKRGVGSIIYPTKAAKSVVASGPVVAAAPKASLIDQLTGKSSWETVAWVLLALCIVLAVALIALIIFQVRNSGAKNGNYERLDGHNEAVPIGTEKQGLLAPNPKKNTQGALPGGYSDMPTASTPPSAPVVEEAREQQQF